MRVREITCGFLGNEDGAVTIEASLWVAFFATLVGLIVDLSLVLLNKAEMWNIAADTSRQIAIGAIAPADASTYANEQSMRGAGYTVDVTQEGETFLTTVSIPMSNVIITSWFTGFDATMSATVTQRSEPAT